MALTARQIERRRGIRTNAVLNHQTVFAFDHMDKTDRRCAKHAGLQRLLHGS